MLSGIGQYVEDSSFKYVSYLPSKGVATLPSSTKSGNQKTKLSNWYSDTSLKVSENIDSTDNKHANNANDILPPFL